MCFLNLGLILRTLTVNGAEGKTGTESQPPLQLLPLEASLTSREPPIRAKVFPVASSQRLDPSPPHGQAVPGTAPAGLWQGWEQTHGRG